MNVQPLQQSVANIGAWATLRFFQSNQFTRVCQGLNQETRQVWPSASNVLNALQLVQPCDVRVVVLGQDPYPAAGRATGLAFAVPQGRMPQSGSLPNIFEAVRIDIGHAPANSDLTHWAQQGVLLLNTVLTVPEGIPDGHRGIGWSPLIRQVLQCLAPRPDIAWFMCGYRARQRLPRNRSAHALVIKTGHPSRGHLFIPNCPFSRINRFLGNRSINW